jgi:N-acetylglucosamine-6-phosphate deacetylase
MTFALTGCRIFTGERFIDDHAVVIAGERIRAVTRREEVRDAELVELSGGLLAPGFIDVQVNGGGGALLNGDPSLETVRNIAVSHRRFGTTGLMPTVITDAPSVIRQAGESVGQAIEMKVPGVLGIHVEGPFLDPARRGAHAARFIREMKQADIDEITKMAARMPVMLTLAPNRVSPAEVKALSQAGVLVSLGHSDATYEEACRALAAGASAFTHLFNAMSPMNGREPGMVGAALANRGSYAGIIADGHHVHEAALRVAFAAKHAGHMMLVTDAMPTAAGGPSSFLLQGREVRRIDGRLTLSDGTLAGSDLTMDRALRHCVKVLGIGLAPALRMASLNPASFLGRGHELGRIAPGHRASLVHLCDELSVRATWIDGSMNES